MGVPAKDSARFALKFFLAAADFAQAVESAAAKFTAGPGKSVGDVGNGNAVFLRELVVRDVFIAGEVVGLEEMKGAFALWSSRWTRTR
jgi:hypothetical protein